MKSHHKSSPSFAPQTNSKAENSFEARTPYPIQRDADPVEQVRETASQVMDHDLSGYNVTTNSSLPGSVGALATIQKKEINLAPSVSDLSQTKNKEVLAHEFGHAPEQERTLPVTGHIGGTPVNTDQHLENKADKVARETVSQLKKA